MVRLRWGQVKPVRLTLIAVTTQGGIPAEENKEANTSMTWCCISSFIQRLIYVRDLIF